MNKRVMDLMVKAGYAAPELAGRANKLAELLINDVLGEVLEVAQLRDGNQFYEKDVRMIKNHVYEIK